MTLTDPIGDMFSRIRNGQMRLLNSINIPSSTSIDSVFEFAKLSWCFKETYNSLFVSSKVIIVFFSYS